MWDFTLMQYSYTRAIQCGLKTYSYESRVLQKDELFSS